MPHNPSSFIPFGCGQRPRYEIRGCFMRINSCQISNLKSNNYLVSSSQIRSSRLYLARRSLRAMEPILM